MGLLWRQHLRHIPHDMIFIFPAVRILNPAFLKQPSRINTSRPPVFSVQFKPIFTISTYRIVKKNHPKFSTKRVEQTRISTKQTNNVVWSASELYRPCDRHLAKLLPTFADRGCHMISVTGPYGRIIDFLDRSRYFFFQVAPQWNSRGWVDPVPDILLRKSCSAGNRTRASEFLVYPQGRIPSTRL
jgi:hypothetical protein